MSINSSRGRGSVTPTIFFSKGRAPGVGRSLQETSGSAARLVENVENTPRQLVIDAYADDVIVKAHALIAGKDGAGGRIEVGFVLQPDVEIFDLRRPVPV